ncbi:MAG TPA: anhydro-N-acetylmuramic acid kinase [Silvibacterium sp.]|nr:anhydro-N-acetylmuramic acid kinase [Silvibacterium sp.]
MKAARPLTLAGVMSGTSADGIDVALVRIVPHASAPRLTLLVHYAAKYPAALRQAVLAAMNASQTSTAELARLNWRLGIAYADAIEAALKKHPIKLDLIGCHGQTIYHQAKASPYAGKQIACTWQIGEPALIARRIGIPVVSNFRPADMAVAGQGAPLVPLLDFTLFAHKHRARVLQNIGGIGNLTAIPAGASTDQLIAFDTGPGNMIIDALMARLFGEKYDRGGRIALRGRILQNVLTTALRQPYFRKSPPKSAGREQFGAAFTENFLHACNQAGGAPEDAIATSTAFTAATIARAYERFVQPRIGAVPVDFIVSGGGARNLALMDMLRQQPELHRCKIMPIDDAGIPSQAKEAVAFALLAWQTWHRLPGNIPAATGASQPVILGQISYV